MILQGRTADLYAYKKEAAIKELSLDMGNFFCF
jgi:hypothetical protein